MSLPKKLAQGVRRPIASVFTLARHSASYPFDTPLTREIHRLERRGSEKAFRAMHDFPGLEPAPRHGLQGLAYQVVRHYKPRVVVGLGVGDGLAALAIAAALRDNAEGGKLFAVDPWTVDDARESFEDRRAKLGLEAVIVPLRMNAPDAYDKVGRPIDLLVIDARKGPEAAEADWEEFAPLVRPGGMVAFRDVRTDPAVRKFWRKLTRMHENHTVRRAGGLGFIRTKQQ